MNTRTKRREGSRDRNRHGDRSCLAKGRKKCLRLVESCYKTPSLSSLKGRKLKIGAGKLVPWLRVSGFGSQHPCQPVHTDCISCFMGLMQKSMHTAYRDRDIKTPKSASSTTASMKTPANPAHIILATGIKAPKYISL